MVAIFTRVFSVVLCVLPIPLQESSEQLVAGKSFQPPSRDSTSPLGPKARAVVQTTIEVRHEDRVLLPSLDHYRCSGPVAVPGSAGGTWDINMGTII